MVKAVIPLVSFLFAASLVVEADTLILQSGETFDGSVVSETDSEVVFSYQVSSGITDQQTFARSDIKELRKVSKAQLLYEQIKDLKIQEDSLSAAEYQRSVSVLSAFIDEHPESPHAEELKKNLAAFKAEAERVGNGELKWQGRWYSEDEASQRRYQITAYRYFQRMQEQVARHDLLGALNTFHQIESNYPGARVYPDTIVLAQRIIPQLAAQVDRAVANFKIQDQRYKDGIGLVLEPEKSQMIAARAAQLKNAEKAIQAASSLKWKPFYPIVDKSADELKKKCETESARLAKLPVSKMRESLRVAETIQEEITAKKADVAAAKLKEAESLWKENELLTRLSPAIKTLEEEARAEAKAEAEAKKAEARESKAKGKGKKGKKKAPEADSQKEEAEEAAAPEAKA